MDGQTDGQTDGLTTDGQSDFIGCCLMDRQTDESDFKRCCLTNTECPKLNRDDHIPQVLIHI